MLKNTHMNNNEIKALINLILIYEYNGSYDLIGQLLLPTKHNNKMYSLAVLRSTYSFRDNFQDLWTQQLNYAKVLYGDEAEEVLKGLDEEFKTK